MANKPLEILKFNGDNNNYPIRTLQVVYGICRTAASTAAKQVDVDINTTTGYQTNFQLEKGASVYVYFEQTNSANNPTLQIYNYNTSTQTRTAISGQTAASIYYNGAAVSKSYLQTKRVIQFIYDGNYFQLVGWVDSNSDTKVTQNPQTTDEDYPVIIKAATAVTAVTTTLGFDTDSFTYNPNSNTLKVTNTVMTSADVAALVAKNGGVIYFELKTPTASTNGVTVANAPVADTDVANKQYVDQAFAANDAMIFKGTIGAAAQSPTVTSLPREHNAGWTYRVITAGSYAGYNCEVGDLLICIIDGTDANNAHWSAVQYNIDKPAYLDGNTVTNGDLPAFDSTSGKLKDSGYYVNTTQQSIKYVSTWTPGTALKFGDDISVDDITSWEAGIAPTLNYSSASVSKVKTNGATPQREAKTATIVSAWTAGSVPSLTSASVTASHVKTAGSVPTSAAVSATKIFTWDSGDYTAGSQNAIYSAGILTFTLEAAPIKSITKPSLSYDTVDFYSITNVGSMPTFEDIIATKITNWSAGSKPSLTYDTVNFYSISSLGSMPTFDNVTVDHITSWDAGTIPLLSYHAKAIPNVVSANVPGTLTTASTAFYALSKR